jgi:hypothetical protein
VIAPGSPPERRTRNDDNRFRKRGKRADKLITVGKLAAVRTSVCRDVAVSLRSCLGCRQGEVTRDWYVGTPYATTALQLQQLPFEQLPFEQLPIEQLPIEQ